MAVILPEVYDMETHFFYGRSSTELNNKINDYFGGVDEKIGINPKIKKAYFNGEWVFACLVNTIKEPTTPQSEEDEKPFKNVMGDTTTIVIDAIGEESLKNKINTYDAPATTCYSDLTAEVRNGKVHYTLMLCNDAKGVYPSTTGGLTHRVITTSNVREVREFIRDNSAHSMMSFDIFVLHGKLYCTVVAIFET